MHSPERLAHKQVMSLCLLEWELGHFCYLSLLLKPQFLLFSMLCLISGNLEAVLAPVDVPALLWQDIESTMPAHTVL